MDEPRVSMFMVRMLLATGGAIGLPRAELMAASGLQESDLVDLDAWVPLATQVAVGRYILASSPDVNVGLAALRQVGPATFGALGYALNHAATLGEALQVFMRYQGLVTSAVHWRLVGERVRISAHPSLVELGHPVEHMVGLWLVLGRALTRQPWVPVAVQFPHQPIGDIGEHTAFFGVAPTFGADYAELHLTAELLALPIRGAQLPVLAGLFPLLDARLDAIREASTAPGTPSVQDQVRAALREQLPQGRADKTAVARALGVSSRTLSRRLKVEGTRFQDLLDDARCELAQHWLIDPQLAVYEVAFLLGYSDPSTFHRAFRRWTGEPPARWRQTRQRPAMSPA